MSMVVDGHTTIEHSIPLAHLYADVHQLWRQTKVAYTPTLVVAYGGNWGENYSVSGHGRLERPDPDAVRSAPHPGQPRPSPGPCAAR